MAASQHMTLGAISTARKSPVLFDLLAFALGAGFFAGSSREILSSSFFSTLIMTGSGNRLSDYAKDWLSIRAPSALILFFRMRRILRASTGAQCHRATPSQTSTCEHCDGRLTGCHCKLNGQGLTAKGVQAAQHRPQPGQQARLSSRNL